MAFGLKLYKMPKNEINARVQPTAIHAHGTTAHLAFTPEELHLFDAEKDVALV